MALQMPIFVAAGLQIQPNGDDYIRGVRIRKSERPEIRSVGFRSVGFRSVGFPSVGFPSVGFRSVGFPNPTAASMSISNAKQIQQQRKIIASGDAYIRGVRILAVASGRAERGNPNERSEEIRTNGNWFQTLGHSLSRNRDFPFGSYGKIVYLCTQQPIKQKDYETDDDDSQITDSNGNGVGRDGLRSAV